MNPPITPSNPARRLQGIVLMVVLLSLSGCTSDETESDPTVPHEERWGIYALDPATGEVELIVSSEKRYFMLRLSDDGERFLFTQQLDGDTDEHEELCTMNVDGSGFTRLTDNDFMDLYPAASPGDTVIVFLSSRQPILNLDLYMIDADGSNERLFYDSGSHDSDVHWSGDLIAFTAESRIWTIPATGGDPTVLTDPPQAGEWGQAPFPWGDYDPRLNPAADRVAFSRMVDAENPHGGYDIYLVNADGSGLIGLTDTGHTQGLASWSHDGEQIVFSVAAIGADGFYDIYLMNADGGEQRNITPEYFPPEFLCHAPMFSGDDALIYFVGEWWE